MSRRVLIVDDDPELVKLMVLALERDGWEAVGATSLSEAVKAGGPWSVVVADIRLPNGDGRHMRELHPQTPMLIISGAPQEGPDLVKPFSLHQLRQVVQKIAPPE